MRTSVLVAMAVIAGCGGPDRVYTAPEQPQPSPGPTMNPWSKQKCEPTIDVAVLRDASARLPDGVSEEDAITAVQQLLFMTGTDVERRDVVAHTYLSKPVTGQTILMSCRPINQYFVFAYRATITQRTLHVSIDCRTSVGWEAGAGRERNRGELVACEASQIVSKGDSIAAQQVVDGALAIMTTP